MDLVACEGEAFEECVRYQSDRAPDIRPPNEFEIEALKASHKVNSAECETLMAVKEGGDAAIHRNYVPTKLVFATLASPLVDLLRRNAAHAEVAAVAAQIPARPPRIKRSKEPPKT